MIRMNENYDNDKLSRCDFYTFYSVAVSQTSCINTMVLKINRQV